MRPLPCSCPAPPVCSCPEPVHVRVCLVCVSFSHLAPSGRESGAPPSIRPSTGRRSFFLPLVDSRRRRLCTGVGSCVACTRCRVQQSCLSPPFAEGLPHLGRRRPKPPGDTGPRGRENLLAGFCGRSAERPLYALRYSFMAADCVHRRRGGPADGFVGFVHTSVRSTPIVDALTVMWEQTIPGPSNRPGSRAPNGEPLHGAAQSAPANSSPAPGCPGGLGGRLQGSLTFSPLSRSWAA